MIEKIHKFPYKWNLSDGYPAKGVDYHGCKVFGTFICGGGSSMGYKLAGFEHLGGVEIDKEVADIYNTNHSPKYLYNEDIRQFLERDDIPEELFSLDLLDGSPPCSTFSMAGSREDAWGKKKQFREGQTKQTLDDLVFVYCDLIIKLKPKVFLLENVKGIIQGNAKVYSKKIVQKMEMAGYVVQVFCLNAASMGVPQKRERVFFIGHKKEFVLPKLKMEFNEKPILFGEIKQNDKIFTENEYIKKWNSVKQGEMFENSFSTYKLSDKEVCPTLTGTQRKSFYTGLLHSTEPRKLNTKEFCLIGSYALDYNFKKHNNENFESYLIGMSVPPVMTAQISHQIYLQWLGKIKG